MLLAARFYDHQSTFVNAVLLALVVLLRFKMMKRAYLSLHSRVPVLIHFLSPTVNVSIDACFTQKQRKGQSTMPDAPREHPDSTFVSEGIIKAMEEEVGRLQGSSSWSRRPAQSADEDFVEEGMNIPNSVLDGCGESFKAVDERQEKASTQFFTDTGLMALLCCHNRVLWVANMTTASEHQYYALALLQKLFKNFPDDYKVGVLYDISCQLHCSCNAHDLLPEYRHRIIFRVSVFHAYGHQWPCQLRYHPRKRKGFGFSNGEGCERFWAAIRRLIPSLRVSGVSTIVFSTMLSYLWNHHSTTSVSSCWMNRSSSSTRNCHSCLVTG